MAGERAELSGSGTGAVDVCLRLLPRVEALAARHFPGLPDLEVAYGGVENGKVRSLPARPLPRLPHLEVASLGVASL